MNAGSHRQNKRRPPDYIDDNKNPCYFFFWRTSTSTGMGEINTEECGSTRPPMRFFSLNNSADDDDSGTIAGHHQRATATSGQVENVRAASASFYARKGITMQQAGRR